MSQRQLCSKSEVDYVAMNEGREEDDEDVFHKSFTEFAAFDSSGEESEEDDDLAELER